MTLDTPLHPSKIRYGLWLVFFALVFLLVFALGLRLWQIGILLGLCVVLGYSELIKPKLIHLVSPSQDTDTDWQFLLAHGDKQALCLGKVVDTHHYGFCLVLIVQLHHPTTETKKWLIFQDMLKTQDYQKLIRLTKFS